MFKPEEAPWQLKPEDLKVVSASKSAAIARIPGFKPHHLLMAGGLLVAMTIWLVVQGALLAPGYRVAMSAEDLPSLKASKVAVVPVPVRYSLMKEGADKTTDNMEATKPAPPEAETGMIPVNYTPDNLPPKFLNPEVLAPEEPEFSLVGIAQGRDGEVATVKVVQDNVPRFIDVREGMMLLNEYKVSRIETEYVVLINAGKTIRVD